MLRLEGGGGDGGAGGNNSLFVSHLLERSGDHRGPRLLCWGWRRSLRLLLDRERRDKCRGLIQLVALLVDEAAVKGHILETAPGSGRAKKESCYKRSTNGKEEA